MATVNPITQFIEKVGLDFGQAPVGEPADRPDWHPVYQGLVDRGLSSNLAAGIAASTGAETANYDTNALLEDDTGSAFGLMQWRGERQRQLRAEAERRGVDPGDFDLQLDQVMKELEGLDPQSRNIVRDTEGMGIAESGEHFRRVFERPGEDTRGYADTARRAGEISTYLGNQDADDAYRAQDKVSRNRPLLSFAQDANDKADMITKFTMGIDGESRGLSMGTDVPRQPEVTRGVGPSAGISGPPPSGSPTADGSEPEGGGLMDKIGAMLYPDAENPREKFGQLLGGLGVGLGQMSSGDTVNLQPYFNNIAAQKQSIIENKRAAVKDRQAQQMAGFNANTNRMNADTARLKYEQDVKEDNLTRLGATNIGFNPELLEKYADNPLFEDAFKLMASSNPDDVKVGRQRFKERSMDVATDEAEHPEGFGDLIRAFEANDMAEVANIMDTQSVSAQDFKRAADVAGPSELLKRATDLTEAQGRSNEPGAVSANMVKLAKADGGLVDEGDITQANLIEGRKYEADLNDSVSKNRMLNASVDQLIDQATNAVVEGITTEGAYGKIVNTVLGQMEGSLPIGWVEKAEDYMGAGVGAYQKLDTLSKLIVLTAAKPLIEGTGTITEAERKTIAGSIFQMSDKYEAKMDSLIRLQTLGDIDLSLLSYYSDNKGGDRHSNYNNVRTDINLASAATVKIMNSRNAWHQYKNQGASPEYASRFNTKDADGNDTVRIDTLEIYEQLAPRLSPKEAAVFMGALTQNMWIDRNTGILMQGNVPADQSK